MARNHDPKTSCHFVGHLAEAIGRTGHGKADWRAAPANEAVEWRTELIESTVYKKSPYSGNPSHEIDQAWNQLTNGTAHLI